MDCLFIRNNASKMVCDCSITNATFLLPLFPMLFLCNKSKVNIFPPTLSNWMFKQLVFFHGSGAMVLVICDQTFLLFDGTIHVIFLENNVTNYTLHGLSTSKTGFTIVVDHKKNAKIERTYGEGSRTFLFWVNSYFNNSHATSIVF